MKLKDIYDLAVEMGIKADPRGVNQVKKRLVKLKREYDDLPDKKKKYFDEESLKNPYSDTRILFGGPQLEVKKVMAGIDADASEVLLFDRLNAKGQNFDLLISHHPSGHALAGLHEVMEIQVDMFAKAGVPENVAHALLDTRMQHVKRKFSPLNHGQTIDAAKLLDVPLLAIHTVWDNLGNKFVEEYLAKKDFETLGEVLEAINDIPEFMEALRGKNGPFLASGTEKSRVGKIVVEFTGGTSPSKELMVEMARAGVGTVVTMHIPEDNLEEIKKLHINVIDCGHMAADSIGANIFLDELEKRGIEVTPCSGLIRVKRRG